MPTGLLPQLSKVVMVQSPQLQLQRRLPWQRQLLGLLQRQHLHQLLQLPQLPQRGLQHQHEHQHQHQHQLLQPK